MAWVMHEHADVDTLAASVATELQAFCGEAIALRGQALLALGGGRTPLPLYRRLARCPLPWSQVTLLPTDERCVPHDDPACNLREIGAAFAAADGVELQGLTPPNGDPETSERHARAALAQYPQPFDAVVLGMGMDGHTASLFPGVPRLPEALDPASDIDACRIDPQPLPPEAPYPRVTLTAARLLRARSLHLYLSGADKRAVLERALRSHDPLRYPIGAFLHAADARLHVHWSP
ncbi:6-phosphogluconolactonase [Novilysobacter erysipheiresistens]|uniref:6-phosphogluconolactonase n=1 Tax=Novilysobacter erysipheiresistens TaxID=1749332 RepID=A0ABU7YXT2_9GAMM